MATSFVAKRICLSLRFLQPLDDLLIIPSLLTEVDFFCVFCIYMYIMFFFPYFVVKNGTDKEKYSVAKQPCSSSVQSPQLCDHTQQLPDYRFETSMYNWINYYYIYSQWLSGQKSQCQQDSHRYRELHPDQTPSKLTTDCTQ